MTFIDKLITLIVFLLVLAIANILPIILICLGTCLDSCKYPGKSTDMKGNTVDNTQGAIPGYSVAGGQLIISGIVLLIFFTCSALYKRNF